MSTAAIPLLGGAVGGGGVQISSHAIFHVICPVKCLNDHVRLTMPCKNSIIDCQFTYMYVSFIFMYRIEPHHEKTCLCHMRTTKAQISLRIRAV